MTSQVKVNVPRRADRQQEIRERLYEAALSSWADWLHTFLAEARSARGAAAILRQANAMDMRQATPGVYSNPTLGFVLAEEKAWWSAAASVDSIIMDLPKDERVVVLGTALGYSQTTIGEAIGLKQQEVSKLAIKARETVIPRLLLTAGIVRYVNGLHDLHLAPPVYSGVASPCAV